MALPSNQKRKKFGKGEILQEAPPAMASRLSSCLDDIKISWQKKRNNIAGLWQDWSKIAGEPLASNCKPLSLRRGMLVIGAKHPQWLQALQYNRTQLLARIRTQGYEVRDLRIQQYHPRAKKNQLESEDSIWGRHPSRIDVHGIAKCSQCSSPAPAGEMALWGMCGFCRRAIILSNE
ncbi:DUF721 domain-containing protein [Prochlorococcus sp. MIT 1307]|uniref:DUF721 domain-containing protein n=1 Tax=Prochlorococcus sp. MIT 1307 TaxID=3096219 RepID=UPI002A74BA14|nr:DUF721 domain-containing protein [Prochlorococcus sp. MIT 1307]